MPEPLFPKWEIDTPLEQVIGEAVGAASMCWENLDNAGKFDMTMASRIIDEVVENVRNKLFFDGS